MLTTLKQQVLKHVSRLYKRGNERLKIEFLYTERGWIPTWQLADTLIEKIDTGTVVNKTFIVELKEGDYIKRVLKTEDQIKTTIYLVTREGLIEIPYEYTGGYKLNTGVVLREKHR